MANLRTEADLSKDVDKALRKDPRVIWFSRMNSGLFRARNGPQVIRGCPPGTPDRLVFLRDSTYQWLELKQPGEYPTVEQRQFINKIRKHGGKVDIVRSVKDLLLVLDGVEIWKPRVEVVS